ncbi:MAG: SirB1 family protein [Burkholderiales bacterium]
MTSGQARFAEVLGRDEAEIDLARACLMVAEDAYPGLDVDGYLGEIERLAARLRSRLPPKGGAESRVVVLNQFLFDEMGFQGNADDYYDPRNSYLNEVIDRRSGIPITLSILYLEIGHRIGLPLEGVSFPGHFLVRMRLRGAMLVLDPFTGGEAQSEADLRERLLRVVPAGESGGVPVGELPLDPFLEPAGKRQILARLLRNLKGIYRDADQPQRLLDVLNRMLVVSPEAHGDLRERGLLYQRLECYRAALNDLKTYSDLEPEAPDIDDVRATLVELSARCARLN